MGMSTRVVCRAPGRFLGRGFGFRGFRGLGFMGCSALAGLE